MLVMRLLLSSLVALPLVIAVFFDQRELVDGLGDAGYPFDDGMLRVGCL